MPRKSVPKRKASNKASNSSDTNKHVPKKQVHGGLQIEKVKGESKMPAKPESLRKSSSKTTQTNLLVDNPNPSDEEIALRAWQIWQDEGCPAGKDVEHWIRAEAELSK